MTDTTTNDEYHGKIRKLHELVRNWGENSNKIHVISDNAANNCNYRSKIYFEFDWEFDSLENGNNSIKLTNSIQLAQQLPMVKVEMGQIMRLTANFPHLFPRRTEFSKVGLWIKMSQLGEIMLKWMFFYDPSRISRNNSQIQNPNQNQNSIHDIIDNWLTTWKDYYSFHVSDTIVSIYYQIENTVKRGQVETKKKHYYHWKGVRQLRERIADFVYYISPDRFTQINWYTQSTFYDILLREIQYSSPIFPLDSLTCPKPFWNVVGNHCDSHLIRPIRKRILFCFGRDIGAITLLFAPYFQHIRGFTYCPIVHRDCEQNWIQYARNSDSDINKAKYIYAPRAKLYKSFLEPVAYPDSELLSYVLVWSSGRHGLKEGELKWLEEFSSKQYIESMVYISCNLKTLHRDIMWIREHLKGRGVRLLLRKIYTLNQFPGTDYMETHIWWDFV